MKLGFGKEIGKIIRKYKTFFSFLKVILFMMYVNCFISRFYF